MRASAFVLIGVVAGFSESRMPAQTVEFGGAFPCLVGQTTKSLPTVSPIEKPRFATGLGDQPTPHLLLFRCEAKSGTHQVRSAAEQLNALGRFSRLYQQVPEVDVRDRAGGAAPAWVLFVFNPASADPKAPDATPRLKKAAPCLLAPEVFDRASGGAVRWLAAWCTVSIDATGAVRDVTPDPSVPEALRDEVCAAVRGWTFAPARRAGKTVAAECRVSLPVVRLLSDPGEFRRLGSGTPATSSEPKAMRFGAAAVVLPESLLREHREVGIVLERKLVGGAPGPFESARGPNSLSVDRQRRSESLRSGEYQPGAEIRPRPEIEISKKAKPAVATWSPLAAGNVSFQIELDARGGIRAFDFESAVVAQYVPFAARNALAAQYAPPGVGGFRGSTQVSIEGSEPVDNVVAFKLRPGAAPMPDTPPRPKILALPIQPNGGGTGTATAEIHVDAEGRVVRVDVRSASAPEFGHALRAALEACSFFPATRGGVPIPAVIERVERFGVVQPKSALDSLAYAPELLLTGGIQQPSSLDSPPRPLVRVPIVRPRSDPRLAGPGEAVIEFTIDARGAAGDFHVVSASHDAFAYAAIQAVSCWLFNQPRMSGRPAAVRVKMPFQFPALAPAVAPER